MELNQAATSANGHVRACYGRVMCQVIWLLIRQFNHKACSRCSGSSVKRCSAAFPACQCYKNLSLNFVLYHVHGSLPNRQARNVHGAYKQHRYAVLVSTHVPGTGPCILSQIEFATLQRYRSSLSKPNHHQASILQKTYSSSYSAETACNTSTGCCCCCCCCCIVPALMDCEP